jgi:hypothetical protein
MHVGAVGTAMGAAWELMTCHDNCRPKVLDTYLRDETFN